MLFSRLLFLPILLVSTSFAALNIHAVNLPKAIANIPTTGTVKQTRNGYTYLSVSDRFISVLYTALRDTKQNQDLKLYRDSNSVGAHITLYKKPNALSYNPLTPLLGKRYPFKITRLATFEVHHNYHHKRETKVWYVAFVKIPQIEKDMRALKINPPRLPHLSIGYSFEPDTQSKH